MNSLSKLRNCISATFLAITIAIAPAAAHAQGCSQCKDNTAATPPDTQRAYRHAILLLTVAASGLFGATVFLLRRNH